MILDGTDLELISSQGSKRDSTESRLRRQSGIGPITRSVSARSSTLHAGRAAGRGYSAEVHGSTRQLGLAKAAIRVAIVVTTSTGIALVCSKLIPYVFAVGLSAWTLVYGEHEKRNGERDENWPDWYAEHIVREQAGKEPPT